MNFVRKLSTPPMANSTILRSFISNFTQFTPRFLLNSSQTLITRPFTSSESIPICPTNNSNPPISSDPSTKPTLINPLNKIHSSAKPRSQKKLVEDLFVVRIDGLFVNAGKVFDKMPKRVRALNNNRKLTHEALEKSRGHGGMLDVVAHIAVLETYANASLTNDSAHKVYLKMLGAGAIPNEHTYNMLIKLLASTSGGDWMLIRQAQKYLIEMLEMGMRPDAPASVAIFRALAKEGRVREGKEFMEDVKARGFVVDDKMFREVLKGKGKGRGSSPLKVLQGKTGDVIKTMLEILFAKKI